MVYAALFLTTLIYSTLAKKYSFGTFNVGLSPNVAYRNEKIAASITKITNTGFDVLCLQQVPFKQDIDKFTSGAQTKFPYSYTAVNPWTTSERATPRTACSTQQQQYFNNPQLKACMQFAESTIIQSNDPLHSISTAQAFLRDCISPAALNTEHPGHLAYLAIGQSLEHSECLSCISSSSWLRGDDWSKVSIYGNDNDPTSISLLNRCSNPQPENYRLSEGWLILSKYPIDNIVTLDMPSDIAQRREYALAEITLKNEEKITFGCGAVFPSYPFCNKPVLPFLTFDLGTMSLFQESDYNGIVSESLNVIKDAIEDSNSNNKKVITGDFSVGKDMMSAHLLYDSFITDLDLQDSFEYLQCTVCVDNTNYEYAEPAHTPDHIFISKDITNVVKAKTKFHKTFIASDGSKHHISDHYGKLTRVNL